MDWPVDQEDSTQQCNTRKKRPQVTAQRSPAFCSFTASLRGTCRTRCGCFGYEGLKLSRSDGGFERKRTGV